MAKTVREMREQIKLIDLVIEIVDSRIPLSSRNPELDKLSQGRARMIVLAKPDLADPARTSEWETYFESQGLKPFVCDLRNNGAVKKMLPAIYEACREKTERDKRKGIMNRPIRAMVAGIPNVGKSTFINSFTGSASLKTGDRPGVTKGRQWIRINKRVELLDTPGILWPKLGDEKTGECIALIGSIPSANLDNYDLSLRLIRFLAAEYPDALKDRYGVDPAEDPDKMICNIALKCGALKKGGEADVDRASEIMLEDLRSGRLGRITIERVRYD